jgi:hypothetical protein
VFLLASLSSATLMALSSLGLLQEAGMLGRLSTSTSTITFVIMLRVLQLQVSGVCASHCILDEVKHVVLLWAPFLCRTSPLGATNGALPVLVVHCRKATGGNIIVASCLLLMSMC